MQKVLDKVKLDEYFASFCEWAVSVEMPVNVLSGGLTPLIRAVLSELVVPTAKVIEIVANEVVSRDDCQSATNESGWTVKFRDESIYGNDKGSVISPYAHYRDDEAEETKPILIFAGDGVSDLSAAKHTELLFAKEKQGKSIPMAQTELMLRLRNS